MDRKANLREDLVSQTKNSTKRGDTRSIPLFCRAQTLAWLNPGAQFVFGWIKLLRKNDENIAKPALDACAAALKHELDKDAIIEHMWGTNIGFFARADKVHDEYICATLHDALASFTDNSYYFKIGLYLAKHPQSIGPNMLAFAGLAMHLATDDRSTSFKWYDEDFLDTSIARKTFYSFVKRSIEQGSFIIHFQPVFTCGSNSQVATAEALVRWRHPCYGDLLPSLFLPILSRLQMLDLIDLHVLERVATLQARRQEFDLPLVPISVNIARDEMLLNTNFAERMIQVVDRYGLDHSLVQFELLEGYPFMDNISNYPLGTVANQIKQLHEEGFSILIDDYGSGASNINTLCTMPFDILKLDKHLVDRCCDDKTVACVLQSLITCVHELGHKVIAEGVETTRQFSSMKDMGCEFIQGFYLSRPLELKDFETLLDTSNQGPRSFNNI